MLYTGTPLKVLLPLVAALIALLAGDGGSQQSKLGKIDFPTSGSADAQAHFLRGVAALHSFWYEEALDEFQQATKLDPDFAMGYWGEAMTYNHPLWRQQDLEAARKSLEKIKETDRLTPKERAFINAIKVLYGEGDKLARDIAYSKAMEKIHLDYPDDLEASAFYALSLLGTVRFGDKGFARQMKAAAIALDVYQKNPDHPGAAHYIIHAFDDPEHAILALPAARRYAEIAPEAHHARHMPSHIFLQLGMWPEAARSNESAWAVSDAWVQRKGLGVSQRDYHSLSWLLYVYMQQGRYSKAEELLALMRKTIEEAGASNHLQSVYTTMATTYAVESERWQMLDTLFAASDAKGEEANHHGGGMGYGSDEKNTRIAFAHGLAAEDAEKYIASLAESRKQQQAGDPYQAKQTEIMELGVTAVTLTRKREFDKAIELMKKATALEEELSPPSGPPDLIKPSHEVFGEILLAANRPKEAIHQFEVSLQRQPNRARSLLGLARALARSDDKSAALSAYTHFLQVWKEADGKLPELAEAQEYLGQTSSR